MNVYKKQLYPPQVENRDKNKDNSDIWKLDNNIKKDVLLPSRKDVLSIYTLIYNLIEKISVEIDVRKEEFDNKSKDTYNIKKYLWSIFSGESVKFKYKDLPVDFVKGSIYKIKQYFMESNNIRDIRGGSMMVDYLNNKFIEDELKKFQLNSSNIIYCGGGNVLLAVPAGKGKELCKHFEREFREKSLTIKCAFEYIETTIEKLLFNYCKVESDGRHTGEKVRLDSKVTERSKLKIYDMDYDNQLSELKLNGLADISLDDYKIENNNEKICDSCDIRYAKYYMKEKKNGYLCPSCARKHLLGKKEDELISAFKKHIGEEKATKLKYSDKFNNGSLDKIFDERDIAIIYGDGNNMGNVVNEITNVFEMMYFSKNTDRITKKCVFDALHNVMGDESIFEVLALGGDDIFIIVPAEYAFKIASKIIKGFDNEFKDEFKDKFKDESGHSSITMSVGIAIAKCSTPIISTFNIAHDRLDNAKEYAKKNKLKEGTIDVVELTGEFHDVQGDKLGEFPMKCSDLDIFIEEITKAKNKNSRFTSQINKFNYAYHTMEPEEFDLFYLYQKSKTKDYGLCDFIDSLYKKLNRNNYLEPHTIDWDDILLMWKRI